jgi:mannosyl-3-phosphoglycerate phosphatase
LRSEGIPLILCTSKTFAEVEWYRDRLRNTHPFIVESGGAIYIPKGYFPFSFDYDDVVRSYLALRLGGTYQEMVLALEEVAARTGVALRGFSDMSAEEIADISSLTLDQAERAKQRDHDEPFLILDPAKARLVERSSRFPLTWGGRFYHINSSDKGRAVSKLIDMYRKMDADILGLGDCVNDLPMLQCVDVPILVRGENGAHDPEVVLPGLRRASAVGAAGLRQELLSVLEQQ